MTHEEMHKRIRTGVVRDMVQVPIKNGMSPQQCLAILEDVTVSTISILVSAEDWPRAMGQLLNAVAQRLIEMKTAAIATAKPTVQIPTTQAPAKDKLN